MSTFIITPRTKPQEILSYFGAAQVSAHVKVEKLKLICRMAEKADGEARVYSGFLGFEARDELRSFEAREESKKFIDMFDRGMIPWRYR